MAGQSRTAFLFVITSVLALALPVRGGDASVAVQRLIHTGQPFCDKKPETESTDVNYAAYMLAACELAANLEQYKSNAKFVADCAEMTEDVKTTPLTEQNKINAKRRRLIASAMQ